MFLSPIFRDSIKTPKDANDIVPITQAPGQSKLIAEVKNHTSH